jgi:pilus assembly protein CpaC
MKFLLTAILTCTVAGHTLAAQGSEPMERVLLTAGRSTVLATDFDITRIAVTNPAIADAVVVRPREVLVDGKGAGTVSLIVWGSDTRRQYDVVVDSGVSLLQQNFQQLFPGENINVAVTDEAVILSGEVSSNDVMLRAAEVARAAFSKASVVNMLQLPSGSPSKQVMLQVRFAEVNRNALLQAGITLFTTRSAFTSRSTTGQFSGPVVTDYVQPVPGGGALNTDLPHAATQFADMLNLFFFNQEQGIGAVLKALQGRGFLQSLAEPNLIAYNGEEASFLAGGEIPIPVVQGVSGQVAVQYKEFGIRLTFRPTIAGDVIRLKLRPEVSALDFNNGVILAGFRIPALSTRRAETDVELRDGQSFAIAGLMNNISQTDRQAVPLLSKLPIIGNLFKSKAERAEQTELMVLITPRLVRALDPDEVPLLPTRPQDFIDPTGEEGRPPQPGMTDAPEGEEPRSPRNPPPPPGAVRKPPPPPQPPGR